MDGLSLTVLPREITGKKVSTLRRDGITPVHLYGSGIDSQSLQADTATIGKVITQAGTNVPVNIVIEGQNSENICFVREVQFHPVTERLVHVDFIRVDVTKPIRANVPINIDGLAPAVRNLGGTLLQPLQSVTVEALPMDIPIVYTLQADSLIDFDTNLYVRDLEISDTVEIINDDDELVAGVVAPRIEREVSVIGSDAEGTDGEATEGGEADSATSEEGQTTE
ncbi:MAG: 50S ribosomal protein L25 [Dehalococcoidia bacterium]